MRVKINGIRNTKEGWVWWRVPLIPVPEAGRSEFKASLVYRVRSTTARAVTQRNPVLKEKKRKYKGGNNHKLICALCPHSQKLPWSENQSEVIGRRVLELPLL